MKRTPPSLGEPSVRYSLGKGVSAQVGKFLWMQNTFHSCD